MLAWLAAGTTHDQARLGDLPDAGPQPGDDRDDRGDDRRALGRADAARDRLLRPPGRRGLARPALRPPAAAHARVRRGRAHGARRASASSTTGETIELPLPDGPGQGAEADDRARSRSGSRSTWRRSARRTRRWPARSPTAGCRRSSRPSTSPSSARCSRRARIGPGARSTASTSRRPSAPTSPTTASTRAT